MNERIKELIEQATTILEPNDPNYRFEFFDKEKFAQLIVKECLDKIESEIELATKQGQTWTAATLQALTLDILDHFDMELSDK